MAETATPTGRLTWDAIGQKYYEVGTDRGVMYHQDATGAYPRGEAWNGLTGVTYSPSGAEATKLYANNGNYVNLYSAEEVGGTITAYTYPDGFAQCDGSAELTKGFSIGQQTRKMFGLTWRTLVGNDTEGQDHGYFLHIVYGATASPSERGYTTINDSPEAVELSWEFTTTPVNVTDMKPTAYAKIDSRNLTEKALKAIEDVLYGTGPTLLTSEPDDWADGYANYGKMVEGVYTSLSATEAFTTNTFYSAPTNARLPLPDEIKTIIDGAAA